jgi:thiosulfate/3-mercaptopyruvate sulfurtransferase
MAAEEQLLVSAGWLLEHYQNPNIRIVDTRFTLGKPDVGREAYEAGHIPGSVFVDLEKDLSAPVRPDRVGGRHPLPAISKLEEVFSKAGISNGHHVIAYDDPSTGAGFYAAHLWWLLRYLGHDRVSVLDGGLPAWIAAGGTMVGSPPPLITTAVFRAHPRTEMLVDADYVSNRGENTVLIDSRAPERFRGEVEPLDWKAGHIPGAVNCNWAEGLKPGTGEWKGKTEQLHRLAAVTDGREEVLVYCGSGVSAGGNLLALAIAGIEDNVKLYAGSWSDWVSDDNRPIETGA